MFTLWVALLRRRSPRSRLVSGFARLQLIANKERRDMVEGIRVETRDDDVYRRRRSHWITFVRAQRPCRGGEIDLFYISHPIIPGEEMMRTLAIFIALVGFRAPALAADDAEFQKQIEKLAVQYADGINSKNADGVLALYAPDSLFIGADGHVERRTDERRKSVEATIAAGVNDEIKVMEAQRFGNAGIGVGTYNFTTAQGAKGGGIWNAA